MINSVTAAFALYTRLRGRSISETELLSGIPVPERSSVSPVPLINEKLLLRLIERAGFSAAIRKVALTDISSLAFPLLLLMKDGGACVAESRDEAGNYRILLPESELTSHQIRADLLNEKFAGMVVYLGDGPEITGEHAREDHRGHWFWHALKICIPIYFDVIVASFIISIFALVSPLFTMNVYDRVVPNNAIDTLWVLAIGTLAVTVFDSVLKFMRTWYTETAAKKSDMMISSRIFEKVLNLRMEEAPRNIGSFASSLREYDSIRNFLTSSVLLIVVDLPFTVILLYVTYHLAGQLVLVPIVMMMLMLLHAVLIRRPLYASLAATYEDSSRKNSLVVETLSGLQDIKTLNSSGVFQGRWEKIVASIAGKSIVSRLISTSVSTLTGILIQLNTILTVVVGVYMIRENQMTMGALIAVMILSSKIIAPMGQLVGLISSWDQTRIAYDSLRAIMAKNEESCGNRSLIRKNTYDGDIEFRNVSFSYPGAETKALDDLSFKIKKGEHVAILGRMGAGKSTIHKLLMDFFRPQEGRILIDNIDIREFSPVALRSQINYVPQDFYLFSGTLRENILMKSPYIDDQSLIAAIQTGGLENFIQSSPRGIDTLIQERGANLSGGQRQGIAIARAFTGNGSIILLDEPANSMDGSTEALVKEQFKMRMRGKTTIFTTHKNSMLDLADRIMVINDGKLIFDGNHDAFMKTFAQKAGT